MLYYLEMTGDFGPNEMIHFFWYTQDLLPVTWLHMVICNSDMVKKRGRPREKNVVCNLSGYMSYGLSSHSFSCGTCQALAVTIEGAPRLLTHTD